MGIKKLEERLQLKTWNYNSLQEDNDSLTSSIRNLEEEIKIETYSVNEISKNCDQLTDKLCKQAITAREHLQFLLKVSKPGSNTNKSNKDINNIMHDLAEGNTEKHSLGVTGRACQSPPKKLKHNLTGRTSQTPPKN